jgi:putative endonuclease
MTNKNNAVLYTGMTNDLARRVWEHKEKKKKGFTCRYNAIKLVYYEIFATAYDAIAREKQIKAAAHARRNLIL